MDNQIGIFMLELVHGCKISVFTVNSYISAILENFVLRL